MHDQVNRRAEFLASTPKVVMRYLKQGHSAERALQLASEHTGVKIVTIRAHWKNFLNDKSKKAVRARNALALELHGLGLSNVNIADRLNLHPVTVSRILSAEKTKRLYVPNSERVALFLRRDDRSIKSERRASA